MSDSPNRFERWAPGVFVAAVLANIAWLVRLGHPWPSGRTSDEHVYLELAYNFWTYGQFGTRVSINYPPLYPMVLAPTFALDSNVARFTAIYTLHALLIAGGSLFLLPALRSAVGRHRAWLVLAAVQFLAGITHHGYHAQTETMFTAMLLGSTGLVWMCCDKPERVGRWLALGLLCGLAGCLRRTGWVIPIAVGLLLVPQVVTELRRHRTLLWKPIAALGIGYLIGGFPEMLAEAMVGSELKVYGGSPMKAHLMAGVIAMDSLANLQAAIGVAGRHLGYVIVTTGGAPLLIGLMVLHRATPIPGPHRQTGVFVLLASAGLVAMTSLHILRHRFRHPEETPWDLYPRYVDPAEPSLVILGVVAAASLFGKALWPHRERLIQGLVAVAIAGTSVGVSGYIVRARGSRYPSVSRLADFGLDATGRWYLHLVAGVLLVSWLAWWMRGTRPVVGAIVLALAAGWAIGFTSPHIRLTRPGNPSAPQILSSAPLLEAPTAPLAVVVYRPGRTTGRGYYRVAFRSDHPIDFVAPGAQLEEWLDAHPDGFALVRDSDRGMDPPTGLETVARKGNWTLQARASRGAD